MKKFLIKFRICEQVGPDDWSMASREILFTEETRLSEVNDWVLKNSGYCTDKSGYKRMIEVFLSEPELFNPTPK
jgi:hypothetical protein